MPGELGTTNLLLGILAAVSLLEAVVIVGIAIAGFKAYRRAMLLVNGIEARHIVPAMARVHLILDDADAILDDVRMVTAKVKEETQRVDHAIHSTIDRIDDAAYRVRSTVRAKADAVAGLVRGLRGAIEWMLRPRRHQTHPL